MGQMLSTQFLPGYGGNDMSQQFGVAFFFVSYMLCVGVVPWKKPWNFFRLQVAAGLPPVLGHKWCMPTNLQGYPITIVINHHLPTLFLLLHLHRSRIPCFQILRFQSPECHSLFTDLEVTSQLFEAINKSNPFSWNYCELINCSIAHL